MRGEVEQPVESRPAAGQSVELGSLAEVARLSLKLGFIAFGGPAAHIALLRQEVVARRGWLSEQYFVDLIGATNLIPGPNSTEMVIHVGRIRAGWRGLIVAGTLFILPAALMVLALAWAYVRYGATPEAGWLLYGIKPVIIAVVAQALWNLGRTALKGPLLYAIAVGVVALYLLGFNEIALLFGGAAVVFVLRALPRLRQESGGGSGPLATLLPLFGLFSFPGSGAIAAEPAPVSLARLFLLFLKIGSVLYGSGYVLLAFLRNDFVERLGWLTDQQLLDAVAIGQFTPGPVFTTATFVGYVVAGFPGAILATLGIFLPSFCFVALLHPLVPRLRNWYWSAALLDGVNAAAIGLMGAVAWQLGRAAVIDVVTALLALGALALLIRSKVNSAWLVVGGGILGIAWSLAFR